MFHNFRPVIFMETFCEIPHLITPQHTVVKKHLKRNPDIDIRLLDKNKFLCIDAKGQRAVIMSLRIDPALLPQVDFFRERARYLG